MIDLKVDVRGVDVVRAELKRIKSDLGKGKALSAALNRTAEKAKSEIARSVSARYALTAAEVRGSVEIGRASGAASRLTAYVTIFGSAKRRGRSLNLIHFLAAVQAAGAARKTRGSRAKKRDLAGLGTQLGFQIKRGAGLKRIVGAFVANKGRTVFERDPSGKQMSSRPGRLTKHSQAIRPVQVVGYAQMFNSREISNRVMAKIRADLPVEVRRAVDMILAKTAE